MTSDEAITQARAKIIWGEPAADVRTFLIENGYSDKEADKAIAGFNSERNNEIRYKGIKQLLLGGLLVFVAGWLIYHRLHEDPLILPHSTNRDRGGIFAIGLYGAYKLTNGIFTLLCPQTEKGSITEIEDQ